MLLVANWKENPSSEAKAFALFEEIARVKRKSVDIVTCPPFIYLGELAAALRKMKAGAKKNLSLGVQDIFWEEEGAFTSEIGPKMIRSVGAKYVIIGHSERRRYLKETDEMINKKIKLALKDGLKVILCVGEPATIRRKGIAAAKAFIKSQLKKDLAGIRNESLIVAYEPVWAIGTGKNDKPEDAAAIADFIKKELETHATGRSAKVLYGGSTNSKNIGDYVQYKSIDGALVGGASLKADEFKKMIAVVSGQK